MSDAPILIPLRQLHPHPDNPRYAVGTLLIDPNSWFYRALDGEGVPVGQIIAFCREFPRVDVVLNLNARFRRMAKGRPALFPGVLGVLEIFEALGREHWLVKRTHAGGCSFLLAVGRNVQTGDHKKLALHLLESQEGEHVMRLVEGERQGTLDFTG
jgi:hypothetical protein